MDPPTAKSFSNACVILDCSNRGGIVLDPFCGSGTTLLAAEKTGRRGYGLELDPHYCDTIIRRLVAKFKLPVMHARTRKTFDEIEDELAEKAADAPTAPAPIKRTRRGRKAA